MAHLVEPMVRDCGSCGHGCGWGPIRCADGVGWLLCRYFATPYQPDWDAASVAFLVFGFAVIEGSIWLGVRPSRASALTLVAIIAAAILVLSLV